MSFNANGGSASEGVTGQAYNGTIKFQTPTREGCTFNGWAIAEGGRPIYAGGQEVTGLTSADGTTVTLYAFWMENTYKVTGTVAEQADGTCNAAGVTVMIKRGGVEFGKATTVEKGNYEFSGVPAGIYIVATRRVDGVDQTMTALVTVGSTQTVDKIALPPGKINSV